MAKKLFNFADSAINRQFDEILYFLTKENFEYKTPELNVGNSQDRPKQDKKALIRLNGDTSQLEYFNPVTKKWYKVTGIEEVK